MKYNTLVGFAANRGRAAARNCSDSRYGGGAKHRLGKLTVEYYS